MDKQEWIKTLKIGDKVAIRSCHRLGGCPYAIATINKITPTGRLKLDNGKEFNADGSLRGGDSWSIASNIEPITDEVLGIVRKHRLINKIVKKLDKIKWMDIPEEDLNAILSVLAKHQ